MTQGLSAKLTDQNSTSLGNLTVDYRTYSVQVDGVLIDLSAKQFDLLRLMLERLDEIIPYATCMQLLWGADVDRLRNLNVLVCRLRQKLAASRPYTIKTVRTRGYGLLKDAAYAASRRPAAG